LGLNFCFGLRSGSASLGSKAKEGSLALFLTWSWNLCSSRYRICSWSSSARCR